MSSMRRGIFICLVQGCTVMPRALLGKGTLKIINDYHTPVHIQLLLMTYRVKTNSLNMAFKVLYYSALVVVLPLPLPHDPYAI